jgi:hypothetical protein
MMTTLFGTPEEWRQRAKGYIEAGRRARKAATEMGYPHPERAIIPWAQKARTARNIAAGREALFDAHINMNAGTVTGPVRVGE